MGILCTVSRGGYTESFHVAYAVAVDEAGEILLSCGDPDYLTYIRSSLKPFQAAAALDAGAHEAAGFSSEELALMCSSHNGEEVHVNTAESMLNKIGLDASAYECGKHPPYHRETRYQHLKDGVEWTALNNNCSGKHAGMLSLAKKLGADPKGYTEKDHPVQKKIFEKLSEITGQNDFPTGIDGCSVPAPIMSLKTVAGLFQKLAAGTDPSLHKLFDAMSSHPYLIGGEKRFDTDFINVMKGRAVAKVGGEAIRGIGIKTEDGKSIGIAVKILDGAQRPAPAALIAVLDQLGILSEKESEALSDYSTIKLTNHRNIRIGDITAEIKKS